MMKNSDYLHLLQERPKAKQEKVMDSISEEFRALFAEEFRLHNGRSFPQSRAITQSSLRRHLGRDAIIEFAEDGTSATVTYSQPVDRIYTEVTISN